MSKTITITKTIPSPPDGWVYDKRTPLPEERFMIWCDGREWNERCSQNEFPWIFSDNQIFAYRVRDEYAERYEALKLPDGWAWECCGIHWHDKTPEGILLDEGQMRISLRRIVNGKAIRP